MKLRRGLSTLNDELTQKQRDRIGIQKHSEKKVKQDPKLGVGGRGRSMSMQGELNVDCLIWII